MSGIDHRAPREQRHERALLQACQREIALARAQLTDARRRGARLDVQPFRTNLLAALEEYAATIERSGAPVPPRLQAELKLYRDLGRRL